MDISEESVAQSFDVALLNNYDMSYREAALA